MLRNNTRVAGVIWASMLKLQDLPLRYVSCMIKCCVLFVRVCVGDGRPITGTKWLKVFMPLLEEHASHWLLICADCEFRKFLVFDSLRNDRDKSRECLIYHAVRTQYITTISIPWSTIALSLYLSCHLPFTITLYTLQLVTVTVLWYIDDGFSKTFHSMS